ncbi:gamma-glutamyltranspeptidase, partial [Rhizophagus irregularis]
MKGNLYGLNGSGPSPESISIEKVKALGHKEIPVYGWIPVTVPGAPASWAALSKRFGKLSLKEVLKPAIRYAEEGYPVSPVLGKYWNEAFKLFRENLQDEQYTSWFETFAPNGRAPEPGEIWKSLDHANTLRAIAETDAESFYKGELAKKIDAFSKKYNGFISYSDLEKYKPQWVDPIRVNYRGYDVWEIPPNGQGLVALMALNILNGYPISEKDNVDTYHKQIEAMKLAFTDGQKYITEPSKMTISVEELLSEQYGAKRRMQIHEKAQLPEA